MKSIWHEIQAERERQREEWGGDYHDDQHGPMEWVAILTKHAGSAMPGKLAHRVASIQRFRTQMVKVAAIAVAAVESIDRRFPKIAATE